MSHLVAAQGSLKLCGGVSPAALAEQPLSYLLPPGDTSPEVLTHLQPSQPATGPDDARSASGSHLLSRMGVLPLLMLACHHVSTGTCSFSNMCQPCRICRECSPCQCQCCSASTLLPSVLLLAVLQRLPPTAGCKLPPLLPHCCTLSQPHPAPAPL